MAAMGGMMKAMGAPKPKELYPSLMDLPDLPLAKRRDVEVRAGERMHSGVALMNQSLDYLLQSTEAQHYSAMQVGTSNLREGLARFESGLAAQRALAEGKAPRNVALAWFKRDMSLLPVPGEDKEPGGVGALHAIVMVSLAGFAVLMIWMYFHKMQRAALLLQRLTGRAPVPAAAGAPAAEVRAAPPLSNAPASSAAAGVPAPPGRWSGKLRIGQIFQETPNVKTFRLLDPLGGELPFAFQPGQYLTVTVFPEGKPVRRSYTIASSPTEHAYVDLTIKREDKGVESRYLHDRVQTGDLLDLAGPSGSFVFTGHECKCIVLIGGGVGVTPMMSAARYLTARCWPGDIYFLFSCRTPTDMLYREELEYLQRRHPNLHVITTMTRAEGTGWKGPTGRISKELITRSIPDLESRRFHICGPTPMMEAVKHALADLGVPKDQVKAEAFGPAIGQPEPALHPEGNPVVEPKAAQVAATTTAVTVTFSRSAKTAPLSPEKSVLEASEDVGVNIPFECRVGTCGVCKVKLLSGQVTMAVEDALTPAEKAGGIILACQAKSKGNVAVES